MVRPRIKEIYISMKIMSLFIVMSIVTWLVLSYTKSFFGIIMTDNYGGFGVAIYLIEFSLSCHVYSRLFDATINGGK